MNFITDYIEFLKYEGSHR